MVRPGKEMISDWWCPSPLVSCALDDDLPLPAKLSGSVAVFDSLAFILQPPSAGTLGEWVGGETGMGRK